MTGALVALAGLGVLGLLGWMRRAARLAAWRTQRAARTGRDAVRAAVLAAVVTGIQWATAVQVHDWRLAVVLAVPALAAGWTLAHRHRPVMFWPDRRWWR